jgi:2-amino-4-hydroxy-6-hydroxymethyldihydropteridine diphosphokinase
MEKDFLRSKALHYPQVVYIGLGSNLAQPIQQIERALQALTQVPQTILSHYSSLYRSKPLANMQQPDYINAVAELQTNLAPWDLLQQLQRIEQQQGRVRGERWGARTLDLDILLYNQEISTDPQLTLPHPGLLQRSFVLYPLYECCPNLLLPNGISLADALTHCSANDLIRIDHALDINTIA